MDNSKLVPVIVGGGNKIHAGYLIREEQKGKQIIKKYTSLCGSNKCSTGHHWQSSVKLDVYHSLKDVNCSKCLEILKLDK